MELPAPTGLSGPSRGVGWALSVIGALATFGLFFLWFNYLKPLIFDAYPNGGTYFIISLAIAYIVVWSCLALIGKSAKRQIWQG